MIALGLDFGTTSISAAAVAGDGELVARVTRPHHADIETGVAGHAEQSPGILFDVALDVLAELNSKLTGPPACLGLTGQMHGMLLVDDQLAPLTNLITWQDKRSTAPVSDGGQTWLETFRSRCNAESVRRTGCSPSPGYLAVTLFTLAGQNQIPAGAKKALQVADWCAARLTDSSPVTDRTNAASTGVYDLEQDCWSDLIDAVGFPRELFPEVVQSGTIIGGLTGELARKTGLPVGLPVASAIGDHQAAVLSSLPAEESAIQVNIGTGGQVSLPLPKFLRTPTSDTRYQPDGRYLLVGAGLAGGDAYAWVRRTCATWLEALGSRSSRERAFADEELIAALNRLAATVPAGCDGLRCEPFFRGTRREPDRRGAFIGVSNENFTPGHVARAVLEGIADALSRFARDQESVPEITGAFTRVIATGNAVRRNPLLAECLAAAFELPVFVPEHEEEAAYGAALLSGVRAGLWQSLSEAGRMIRLVPAATPPRQTAAETL